MLKPTLSFERGFCRVNCVTCSQVCPTGAIQPIAKEQRSAIQVGRAISDLERCIVTTDKVECTACSRACPTGAVVLVGGQDGPKRPAVDFERCIGCGACEYVCPARPLAAIRVEGNLEHRRV
jgi:formate hydrogenlyase subunit 6/NADH:ubiquinone oxidoreductase subunit I